MPIHSLPKTFHSSSLILLTLFVSVSVSISLSLNASFADRLALLSFKSMILSDPWQALASWKEDSHNFCRWRGVTCYESESRVFALYLHSLDLAGPISPSLANLTSLQWLILPHNQLSGPIPPQLGHLSGLKMLNLRNNKLTGNIPHSFRNLSSIDVLDLSYNRLSGTVPPSLWNLSTLGSLHLLANQLSGALPPDIGRNLPLVSFLSLCENEFSGAIPSSLGAMPSLTNLLLRHNQLEAGDWRFLSALSNCSKLKVLSLNSNMLTGALPNSVGNLSARLEVLLLTKNMISGVIPWEIVNLVGLTELYIGGNNLIGAIPAVIGKLERLQVLFLNYNNLSGTIPPSLWNLSSLVRLDVGGNKLKGMINHDIARALPLLRLISLYENQFHGPLPPSLANASSLEIIQLHDNAFTGTILPGFGALKNLTKLLLDYNQFDARAPEDWSFMESLANCSKLLVLGLRHNNLAGNLPDSISNLPAGIESISVRGNKITGSIPREIGNLHNLTVLALADNFLSGTIPASIGMLRRLQKLILSVNKLYGEIPSAIGNLTDINLLELDWNELNGTIPSTLENCPLQVLNMKANKLTGMIPKEILSMSSLAIFLDLSYNLLTGPLSLEIKHLKNLGGLYVSGNRLSGLIPDTIGSCVVLEYLDMGGNQFHGNIPTSLQELRGLRWLDLSSNNFSGLIPEFLETFQDLKHLDLSFNNFHGQVPSQGIFGDRNSCIIHGNNHLCGGDPDMGLPLCLISGTSGHQKYSQHILLAITILNSIVFLCLIAAIFLIRKWIKKHEEAYISRKDHTELSYDMLHSATNAFSKDNLIGVGASGSVYKGVLCGGAPSIAVKVLNLQLGDASKSFMAEFNALKYMKHRNLVKLLATCSCYDFNGNEFKGLVFEYMPNGSLDMWLHPRVNGEEAKAKLGLIQRLNIAIDVASAIEYLHHYGPFPIAHSDVKPSNVLLDYDMNAHVCDFGLARFVSISPTPNDSNSIGLKGSIGYIAPEYVMTNKATTQGDIYSYGILLLEMFTGKRPTGEMFKDGLSLRKYVKMAYPNRLIDIVDPYLLLEVEDEQIKDNAQSLTRRRFDCIASVVTIGMSCTKVLPSGRMQIIDVTKFLTDAKIQLLKFE